MASPVVATGELEARQALEKVLASRIFAQAGRSREFLRYVAAQSLTGSQDAVKEYVIATEVFGRDVSYDPAVDAVVRVEAGRLRGRLRDYYQDEGRDDTVRIEMPRGGYGVLFTHAASNGVPAGAADTNTNAGAGGFTGRSGLWMWIVSGAAVVILITGLFTWRHYRLKRAAAAAGPVAVLVLPLEDRTNSKQDAYLGTGLAESLSRELSNVDGIRVGSEQAAAHYAPVFAAGGAVPFAYVLSGSVELEDQSPVVNLRLNSTRDSSVVLSRRYWASAGGLAEVQAEITKDVVARLLASSPSQAQPVPHLQTTNAAAYTEYLQGQADAQNNSPQSLHSAVAHFDNAVKLDPGFARAWSALAEVHGLLGIYYDRPRDHMPLARQDAQKALALNNSLSEAHGALGVVDLMYDRDIAAARRELSFRGSREDAFAVLSCTSHLLERTGETAEAEQLVRRLLTYEPRSGSLVSELGCINYYRHNDDAALKYYEQSIELAPNSPVPYWGMAKVLSQQGRYKDAVAALDRFPNGGGPLPPLLIAERGYALGLSGDAAGAKMEIAKLEQAAKSEYVDPYFTAVIYLGMRDDMAAMDWLEKASGERSPFFVSIDSEPKWDPLRNDARFQKFAEQAVTRA